MELADDYQTLLVLPLWHEDDTFPFELLQERIKQIELPEMPSSNYVDQENLLPTEMGHYQPLHLKSTIEVELQKQLVNDSDSIWYLIRQASQFILKGKR